MSKAEADHPFPRSLPDGRPYVSPSQIKQVSGCPARYEYSYVLGNDHPESLDLHVGRATHEMIEAWATGEGAAADMESVAERYVREEVPEHLLEEEFGLETYEDGYQEVVDEAARLFDAFIDHQLKQAWTVKDAEQEVIDDSRDPAIRGYLDLLIETPDGLDVVDVKTTKRSPAHGRAREKDAYQVLTYADAKHSQGIPVEGARVLYLVRNKTVKVVDAPVQVTEPAIEWARTVTEGGVDTIRRGDYKPNPWGAGFLCAPDKCGRWETCPGAASWREDGEDGDVDA